MNTDNLKAARKKSGKTQKEVAEGIGIGQGTYKNYETGAREPNGETLVAIANYFDVSTDYLLGRPDAKEPADPIDKLMTVDEMEKDLLREWLSLDETSRSRSWTCCGRSLLPTRNGRLPHQSVLPICSTA